MKSPRIGLYKANCPKCNKESDLVCEVRNMANVCLKTMCSCGFVFEAASHKQLYPWGVHPLAIRFVQPEYRPQSTLKEILPPLICV